MDSKTCLVSVLVPTYQQEFFIEDCLKSIINQKVDFDIEILVGDDCSKDNTALIVDRIALSDKRVVLCRWPQNEGGLKNIDKLLRRAQGKYIAILEGDDFWLSDRHLENAIIHLNNNQSLSFVACNYLTFENDCLVIRQKMSVRSEKRLKFWHLALGNFLQMGTMVFRKDMYSRMPEDSFDFHLGDYPMILMLLKQADGLLLPNFDMAYRLHSGGVWSHQNSDEKIKKTRDTVQLMLNRNYFKSFDKILLQMYIFKLDYVLGKAERSVDKFLGAAVCNTVIILRNLYLRFL